MEVEGCVVMVRIGGWIVWKEWTTVAVRVHSIVGNERDLIVSSG